MKVETLGILRVSERESIAALESDLLKALENTEIVCSTYNEESDIPNNLDLLIVLGGDGTILSAVEKVFGTRCKILGVNLGRVGFLAEAQPAEVESIVKAIENETLFVEERIALQIEKLGSSEKHFALNEIAIEKIDRAMMVELNISVDGDPLMEWSGDGIIVSTPTGSTAYAFSAGGPIIWPTADVIEVAPIAAHALFARPIVLDPAAVVEIGVESQNAIANMDGRRAIDLVSGDKIRITRSPIKVEFVRISRRSFTNRLVAKFRLPVSSWRDHA